MIAPKKPQLFVLYSARHHRCGLFLERADYRILSKEDLQAWSHDLTSNGKLKTLTLHCDVCAEDIPPTHVRVIEDSDPKATTLVPEVEIKKFKLADWIIKK